MVGFYVDDNAGKNPDVFGREVNRWLQRFHPLAITVKLCIEFLISKE